MINDNKIDILCLQEVELDQNVPNNMMSFKDFNIEVEANNIKSRTATYIKSTINYKRRADLEGLNNGMTIIDMELTKSFRLINIYRCFNPTNGLSAKKNFTNQLCIIENAATNLDGRILIIVGDFNLDDSQKHSIEYRNRDLFELLNDQNKSQ